MRAITRRARTRHVRGEHQPCQQQRDAKDANGDGKLSKEEFLAKQKDKEKAEASFKDKDGDGCLTLDEPKAGGKKKNK